MSQFRTLEDGGNEWDFILSMLWVTAILCHLCWYIHVLFYSTASNWGQNIRLSEWVHAILMFLLFFDPFGKASLQYQADN